MKNLFTLCLIVNCLNTFSQQPIFVILGNNPNYDLYSVDIYNCTKALKGSTGQQIDDIAFTPDGRLWGISGLDLYLIDTSNASVTLAASQVGAHINSQSLVALNDSILLIDNGGNLLGMHNATGVVTNIGSLGIGSGSGDLTWFNNELYRLTPGSAPLFHMIKLNSTNTAILYVAQLPSVPASAGAVTVSFPDSCNSIVGFSFNVNRISPLNFSSQQLCPGLFTQQVRGAASITLPTQSPIPTSCNTILSDEMISGQINKFELAPIPVHSSFSYSFDSPTNGEFLIRILDLLGRETKSEKMDVTMGSNKKTFDVSDLNEGMYVFQISDMKSGYMIQSKFLKME